MLYFIFELVAEFRNHLRLFTRKLEKIKSFGLEIKNARVATLTAIGVFLSYVLPVVTVIYFAARQKLPCDLHENYEVVRYCGECHNIFQNGTVSGKNIELK